MWRVSNITKARSVESETKLSGKVPESQREAYTSLHCLILISSWHRFSVSDSRINQAATQRFRQMKLNPHYETTKENVFFSNALTIHCFSLNVLFLSFPMTVRKHVPKSIFYLSGLGRCSISNFRTSHRRVKRGTLLKIGSCDSETYIKWWSPTCFLWIDFLLSHVIMLI